MRIKLYFLHAVLVGFVAGLSSGCQSMSPHENFKMHLDSVVGHVISDLPLSRMGGDRRRLVNVIPLSNGNEEYQFQWIRTCQYMLEVSSKSGKVLGWRTEGDAKDCYVIP